MNMGEKLKTLRTEKKLTQRQVADRIGLVTSAVSSYESGTRYPSYDVFVKLSRIFRVSTDYLLGITDKRNVDVTGLNDSEIELVSQFVDMLRNNKKIHFGNVFGNDFCLSSVKPFILNALSHFLLQNIRSNFSPSPIFQYFLNLIIFFHSSVYFLKKSCMKQ